MHAGLETAAADYVAVIDGDGSMDPAELVSLLDAESVAATAPETRFARQWR